MSWSAKLFGIAVALLTGTACGGGGGGTPPGPTATQIAKVSGDGQVAAAGSTLGTPYNVVVRDAAGSPVAGISVAWAAGAGGGTVTPVINPTDANGTSTAIRTLGTGAGAQTATATRSGLTGSPVTFTTIAQVQGATQIAASGGTGQTDTVLSTLATPISVTVLDQNNAPVSGVTVNWAATGGGAVSQAANTTNGSGVASVTRTFGATSGSPGTTATVTGLIGSPVTVTSSATAGNATLMALNGGNNQSGLVNTVLPTQHSVIVRDVHGNPKGGIAVDWAVGNGGGSVSSASVATGVNGLSAVSRTLGPNSGTHTDSARVVGLSGSPVGFSATATTAPLSANVTVGPGISFSPGSVTISVGGTVTWTWAAGNTLSHNVQWLTGPAVPADSPTQTSGSYTPPAFSTPGTYTYNCVVHGNQMTGSVIVVN